MKAKIETHTTNYTLIIPETYYNRFTPLLNYLKKKQKFVVRNGKYSWDICELKYDEYGDVPEIVEAYVKNVDDFFRNEEEYSELLESLES